jgi:hypothetical protein
MVRTSARAVTAKCRSSEFVGLFLTAILLVNCGNSSSSQSATGGAGQTGPGTGGKVMGQGGGPASGAGGTSGSTGSGGTKTTTGSGGTGGPGGGAGTTGGMTCHDACVPVTDLCAG